MPSPAYAQTLDRFLQGIGITEPHVQTILREHGYDDDTFFVGLKEDDLKAMGFNQFVNGRALIRRYGGFFICCCLFALCMCVCVCVSDDDDDSKMPKMHAYIMRTRNFVSRMLFVDSIIPWIGADGVACLTRRPAASSSCSAPTSPRGSRPT